MTGFARAQVERGADLVRIELKSVNHRQFLWKGRLPDSLSSLEPWAEEKARKTLHRGTLMLNVQLNSPSLKPVPVVQEVALRKLLDQLQAFMEEKDWPGGLDFFNAPATLLLVPGVVQSEESYDQPRLAEAFRECFELALERLVEARTREGAALKSQIHRLLEELLGDLERYEAGLPDVQKAFRERLRKRIQEVLGEEGVELQEADLIREIAIYADKGNVAEELSRLRIHVQEVLHRLDRGGELGRALEFHAQELLREANTLGAKTADPQLSLLIIDLKTTIEKIREQVLNIE